MCEFSWVTITKILKQLICFLKKKTSNLLEVENFPQVEFNKLFKEGFPSDHQFKELHHHLDLVILPRRHVRYHARMKGWSSIFCSLDTLDHRKRIMLMSLNMTKRLDYFLLLPCSSRDQNQDLKYARQALCYRSTPSAPFNILKRKWAFKKHFLKIKEMSKSWLLVFVFLCLK